jgi:hypothetical protein
MKAPLVFLASAVVVFFGGCASPDRGPVWPYAVAVVPGAGAALEVVSPGWLDRAAAGTEFDSRTWTAEEWAAVDADRGRAASGDAARRGQ